MVRLVQIIRWKRCRNSEPRLPPDHCPTMSVSRFKLIFFSPHQNTRQILNHLFETLPQVVGKIGEYEQCAFVTRGTGQQDHCLVQHATVRYLLTGQFKPGPGTQPTIGNPGKLEYVEEDRVEVVVNDQGDRQDLKRAVKELKAVSGKKSFEADKLTAKSGTSV